MKRVIIPFLLFFISIVFSINSSAQVYVELGSGTSSSSSNTITPWTTFFEDGRKQFLFTASELSAAGLNVGDEINAIAFDVVHAIAFTTNLNIRLKSTSQTTFLNFAFESGFTTVFSGTHTPSTGWDQINFSSNYVWDGNGIIVEFCYNNSTFTGNSTVNYSSTSHTSNRYAYTDGNDGCNLNSFGSNSNRANVRFYLESTSVISIERNNPTNVSTSQNNMQFQVNFNKDVVGVYTSDFVLNGSAASNTDIQSINRVNGSQYLVNVTTNNLISGTIGLDIKGVDASGTNSIIEDNGVLDQQALNDIQVTNSPEFGQSFVAGASGVLTKIILRTSVGHSFTGNGVLEIYSGNGFGGSLLSTSNVYFPSSPLFTDINFYLENPAQLTAGNTYTFRFYFPTASTSNIAVSAQTGNPYANGILYQPGALSVADLYFKTFVASSIKPLSSALPTSDESYDFIVPLQLVTTVDSNQTNLTNPNGGATVSVSGGIPPYLVQWSHGANTATITDLNSGKYYVTVTDNNGSSASLTQTVLDSVEIVRVNPFKLSSIRRNNPTDSITSQPNLQFKLQFSNKVGNYMLSDFMAIGALADSLTLNSVVYETDSSCLVNATLNSSVDGTIGIGIKGVGGLPGSNGIYTFSLVDTLSVNHLTTDDYLNQAVIGQTYTAIKENLKQVVIFPKSGNHTINGTVDLKVYSGDYSIGSPTLIHSENVTLSSSTASIGQTFELSNLVATTPGNTYTITFENFSGSGSHAFESAISGTYSGGHVFFTNYNPSNHSGFDLKIKITEAFEDVGGDLDTLAPNLNQSYQYIAPVLLESIQRYLPLDSITTQSNLQFKLRFNQAIANLTIADLELTGQLADSASINGLSALNSKEHLVDVSLISSVDGSIGLGVKGVGNISGSNGIKGISIVDTLSVDQAFTDDYLNHAVIGQTYSAVKGSLKEVVIYPKSGVHTFNGSADLKVYFGSYNAGSRTLIHSESVNLSSNTSASGQAFELSSLVTTAPGNTYSITFENFNGTGSHALESAISGTYPNGQVIFSSYSAGSHSNFDLKIKIIEASQFLNKDLDTLTPSLVQSYQYSNPCQPTSSVQIASACNTYNWPLNGMNYTETGMYKDTILNAAGCDSVITLDLTISNLAANIMVDSIPSCMGSADGGLSVQLSGGIAPFTYTWNNNGTIPIMSGLMAGNYSVVVTDANACSATASKVLSDPDPTIYSNQVVDAICENELNGQISVEVLSGRWPTKVTWSNGEVDSLSVVKAQGFEGNALDNWGYSDTTYLEDCTPVQRYYSIIPYEVDTATNAIIDVDGRAPYNIYPPTVDDVISTYGYGQVDQGSYSNATYFSPYYSSMQDRINLAFFNQGKERYLFGVFDVPGENPSFRHGGSIDLSLKNYLSSNEHPQLLLIDDQADVNLSGRVDSMDSYSYNPSTGTAEFSFEWLPETADGFIYGPLKSDSLLFSILNTSISNRLAFLGHKDAPTNPYGVHKTRTTSAYDVRTKIYLEESGQCVSFVNNNIENSYSLGTNVLIGNASSGANYLSQQNQTTFDTTAKRVITFDPIQLDTASNSAISLNYFTQNLDSDWDSVWYEIKYDSSSNWMNVNSARLDLNSNGWKNLQIAIPQGESTVHFRLLSVTDDTNDLVAFDEVKIQSLTIGLDSIADGNYSFNAVDGNGCSSTASFVVGFTNQSTTSTQTEIACNTYLWAHNGLTYTSSGTYRDTLPNALGCDSIITLNLTIQNETSETFTADVCNSYDWQGMTFTQSGTYYDTIPNAAGCDSLMTLDLTINNTVRDTNAVTSCDSYVWSSNGMTYSASGIYSDTLMAANGCDSISTIDLTINLSTSTTLSMTSCDSYLWSQNGMMYTTSGMYSDTVTNAVSCDSIIVLNLTIEHSKIDTLNIAACDSYTWSSNNQTYTQSGFYNDTLMAANGCDSLMTLNLTIRNQTSETFTANVCNSYDWQGMTFTQSGTYYDTIPNAAGCDSLMTLNLTIRNQTSETFIADVCNSYDWQGMTFTASGTYYDTIPNAAGCDSVITLDLTINNTVRDTNAVTACDSYVWAGNGMTYTASGIYSDTLQTANGCDSIASIDLTINLSTSTTLSMTSCDSYLWSQNGMMYTTSGMYKDTIQNAAGCDSVITLDLTINNTVRDTNAVTACDSYVWSSNGMTYRASGIYSDTLMAANGCDSISTIDLTLNLSTSTTLSVTSCNSYLWSQNGMTYNTTGMYNDTIVNAAGCDSVITLDLTINNIVRDTNAVTACHSYIWVSNGMTYTTNGIYSDTLQAANGCDSIASIDLTIDTVDTRLIRNGFDLTAQTTDPNATFQWIDCTADTAILGATSNTYTAIINGQYSVEITENNCVDTSACISILNVSLEDFHKKESWFTIYPNPTKGAVYLEVGEFNQTERIQIFDLRGDLVLEFGLQGTKTLVDLDGLAAGVYFIRYGTEAKKLIIRD